MTLPLCLAVFSGGRSAHLQRAVRHAKLLCCALKVSIFSVHGNLDGRVLGGRPDLLKARSHCKCFLNCVFEVLVKPSAWR